MRKSIGVCLGASTVSFVKTHKHKDGTIEVVKTKTISHNGDPKGVFSEHLRSFCKEKLPVVVTGRKFRDLVKLPTISEPEASEYALDFINPKNERFTAIASVGGETFIVYALDGKNRIQNVMTGNKCASGTGEFYLQQIKRMNLSLEDAMKVSRGADPFRVSGRCSVFCKSDCTHALNKGTPLGEVAAGLAQMIAEKIEELLRKVSQERVLVVGGTSKNDVVMDFLREEVPNIVIPEEAVYFEALGASLYGVQNEEIDALASYDDIFVHRESSFNFHEPLAKFKDDVRFETMESGKAKAGDRCIIGLDVGSTTTKAVLLRTEDDIILGSVYLRTDGKPVEASRNCYRELLKQVPETVNIVGLGVTGSGRQIAGLHALTDGVINEIVAHATAAAHFDEEVDTIFEIGGQDAKYTYLVNKVPADYAMNEACSAGTGSFLEESAYESLRIDVKDIADIALQANRPPNFNDQCAAFISSDIKTAFQEDIKREDVVAGLVYSICVNYVNRVKGPRAVGKKVFMQGGVCYNKAVPMAMAALTGAKIIVPPEPGLMGAYGVALEVKEKIELGFIKEQPFDLKELSDREVTYGKPFICQGGKEKCDRKCSINMIEVQGKKYPFGGACNKYYNVRYKLDVDAEKYDYVKRRYNILFDKYAQKADLSKDAKTVGINQTFHTHTIYPLYYNFFTQLGFKVVLSDEVKEEGIEREMTSFCYPAQIALGMFQDLLDKETDYIFSPMPLEMYVHDAEHHRKDFNATCVFVSGEPYYLRQAFKDYSDTLKAKMLSPILDFSHGYDTQEKEFIAIGKELGVKDEKKIAEAYRYGVKQQLASMKEMNRMADELLQHLEQNPQDFGIVLFGRPYNSFTDFANKGIPQKFASRGIFIIPYDMFDYHNEYVDPSVYWEVGKKILKGTQIVKRHKQLFGTYITNFLCAPDSILVQDFRRIMATKPSLTLELDGHTADAGINTRIEAALDIIKNYRKISYKITDPDFSDFVPAKIELHQQTNYFITSDGERVPLMDPRVVVVFPSLDDLITPVFAAGFKSLGADTFASPQATPDILKKGRAHTSGKECLPLILCAGHLVDYLDNYWDGKQYVAFFVNESAGSCRVGTYNMYMKDIIRRRRLRNVTTLTLANDSGYAGLGPKFSMLAWELLLAGDVLNDVRSAILANAVDPQQGEKIFDEEFAKVVKGAEKGIGGIYKPLRNLAKRLRKEVPARTPIHESKYVAMCGEAYVRRDGFSHKWMNYRLAEKGFVVKDAYVTEFVMWLEWNIKQGLVDPNFSFMDKLEIAARNAYMWYVEGKLKKILAKSGYYEFERTLIDPLMKHSAHIVPKEHKGEQNLTLGVGMHETVEKFCGLINVGPFGCMPVRFTEALTVPEMTIKHKKYAKRLHDKKYDLPEYFEDDMAIPFLTIESDGNVYPQVIESRIETFALQAERMSDLMNRYKAEGKKVRRKMKSV